MRSLKNLLWEILSATVSLEKCSNFASPLLKAEKELTKSNFKISPFLVSL